MSRKPGSVQHEPPRQFTAENSFGLQLKHRARCLILPGGSLEITITEVQ